MRTGCSSSPAAMGKAATRVQEARGCQHLRQCCRRSCSCWLHERQGWLQKHNTCRRCSPERSALGGMSFFTCLDVAYGPVQHCGLPIWSAVDIKCAGAVLPLCPMHIIEGPVAVPHVMNGYSFWRHIAGHPAAWPPQHVCCMWALPSVTCCGMGYPHTRYGKQSESW